MPLIIASDACRIIDPSSSEYQSAIEEYERFIRNYHTEAQSKNAKVDELSDQILAPLSKIIEGDANSREALQKLRADQDRSLFDPSELLGPRSDQELHHDFRIAPKLVYAKTPPYDPRDANKGVNQGSHQPYILSNETRSGYVGIDARSGSGFADGVVHAFSGFSVAFQATRTGPLITGAAIEYGRFAYNVACRGFRGNATAEGGWNIVLVRIGPLPVMGITGYKYTQWRKRVSNNETSHDLRENLSFGIQTNPVTVQQGYYYVVAAALYCYSNRENGVGSAAAQSLGQGYIKAVFANDV